MQIGEQINKIIITILNYMAITKNAHIESLLCISWNNFWLLKVVFLQGLLQLDTLDIDKKL